MRVEHYEQCPRCDAIGRDTRRDNVGVYSDGSKHCFSCGWHKFPIGFRKVNKDLNVSKSLLPADFTWEVPSRAWQWVIQYGLPISYWQPFTGYSPAEERLVFRVGESSGRPSLVFSIGRHIGGNTNVRKWYVWGDPHKHCEVVAACSQPSTEVVVLVEDLISAHKVANANYTAIPLFGTRLHPCHLYYLNHSPNLRTVTLWLDKDQELRVKREALRLESLINKPVRVVTTIEDPKAISFVDIANILG